MVGCLTGNRVQIIIRTTDTERDQVKKLAQEKDVSMNQFILDAIFDSTSDSSNSKSDIKMIEILEGQLAKKDEQIEQMQKLLDQQQQLTLQTNQQIQHLQLEETKETEKKLEAFEEKEAKKGFFSRWFNS
jgi:predicted HicB family RNase H-like nuclease